MVVLGGPLRSSKPPGIVAIAAVVLDEEEDAPPPTQSSLQAAPERTPGADHHSRPSLLKAASMPLSTPDTDAHLKHSSRAIIDVSCTHAVGDLCAQLLREALEWRHRPAITRR